ncbi:unnamed protein product [Linum tenue]|uniref:Uncharacterized protein n=1 Tax=Linum tenue TaxID=586396 RepID=A0AAV0RLP6_9ROSI|nr:unnamed protein product [Linum tenue]
MTRESGLSVLVDRDECHTGVRSVSWQQWCYWWDYKSSCAQAETIQSQIHNLCSRLSDPTIRKQGVLPIEIDYPSVLRLLEVLNDRRRQQAPVMRTVMARELPGPAALREIFRFFFSREMEQESVSELHSLMEGGIAVRRHRLWLLKMMV